jgi:cyanophycinase
VFHGLGIGRAKAIPIASRSDCQRREWLDLLEKVDGVFLTGGNQLRLSTTIGGTLVAKTIRLRNAAGMHVAGTSAGAAFLCEHRLFRRGRHPGDRHLAGARSPTDHHRPALRQRDRLSPAPALATTRSPSDRVDENTAGPSAPTRRSGGGRWALTIRTRRLEPSAGRRRPVCLIGLRLHILDHGSTFNLHTRVARGAGDSQAGRRKEEGGRAGSPCTSFFLSFPLPMGTRPTSEFVRS